jgi:hypothetical protein
MSEMVDASSLSFWGWLPVGGGLSGRVSWVLLPVGSSQAGCSPEAGVESGVGRGGVRILSCFLPDGAVLFELLRAHLWELESQESKVGGGVNFHV